MCLPLFVIAKPSSATSVTTIQTCGTQSCQGTTLKMLENSHLPNINPQFHVLPMQLYLRHAEPTFMKAQKCPIYLGIHTYNTFKSAFTVIPTPIAKALLFTAALHLLYAIFAYCKIILYTGGCAIIKNFCVILADEFCSCSTKCINLHHIILVTIAYNDLILFNSVYTRHSQLLRGRFHGKQAIAARKSNGIENV